MANPMEIPGPDSRRQQSGRRRARGARTALAAAAFLAALAALVSPRAAVASPYGVDVHAPQGAQLGFVLDQVRDAGIGWVRIDFVWSDVETAPGVFDWSVYDALAAAAETRGLTVYATLAYTPAWATHGAPTTGVPDDPGTWADFCARAAQRYASSIQYWGLWNEPNLSKFWSGTRQQYIDDILIPGADAIHGASPAAKVGGPELAHISSSQWYYWLRDSLNQAGSHLDFVTHHVYDSDGNGAVTNRLTGSTPFGGDPGLWTIIDPSVKEVLQNTGWWGRPFWLTETGWQSGEVSEATQAAYYTGLLNDWFTGQPGQAWVGQLFFYEIEDPPGSPSTWGILRADGSQKPAYVAYENFITTHTFRPTDDAQLVASNLPTTMETGQVVTVSLTFKNTGVSTWSEASAYRLGAANDQDPFAAPRQYLAPGQAVAPGQQATFTFALTAPANPGTYHTQWQMLKEGMERFGDIAAQDVVVTMAPPPEQRDLALLSGRFSVEVSWHDPISGHAGFGRQVGDSDQTGFFWFFDQSNLELMVKMLDGRGLNDHFWFFYGALSNVEYWITVHDLASGAVRTYYNAPGNICGGADTSAFPPPGKAAGASAGIASSAEGAVPGPGAAQGSAAVPEPGTVPESAPVATTWTVQTFEGGPGAADQAASASSASSSCTPGPQILCLLAARFQVTSRWRLPSGAGLGTAVSEGDQTGAFWFFDPANLELLVKVIDGRALTGHFWFFYGALSNVEYWVTVTDTATGASKRYHNPPGDICGVGDTAALD
jgi:Ig-like domain from next to BRCA1 gene/Glycosyl hydrolases family 39